MQKYLIRLMVVLYVVIYAVGFVWLSFEQTDIKPVSFRVDYPGAGIYAYRKGDRYFVERWEDDASTTYEITAQRFKLTSDRLRNTIDMGRSNELDEDVNEDMIDYPMVTLEYKVFGKKKYYVEDYAGVNRAMKYVYIDWEEGRNLGDLYDICERYDADYLCVDYPPKRVLDCVGTYYSSSFLCGRYEYSDSRTYKALHDAFGRSNSSFGVKNHGKTTMVKYQMNEGEPIVDYVTVSNRDPIARVLMIQQIRATILTNGKAPMFNGAGKVCHVIFLNLIGTPLFAAGVLLVTRKNYHET